MLLRNYDIFCCKKLAQNLIASGSKLAIVESCTAGGLSYAITKIRGASLFFDRGYVTYSDVAKQEMLDIDPVLIAEHDSVSETISREMAIKALRKSKANLSISITGIASHSEKYLYKDVGLIWFSIAIKGDSCVSRKQVFKGDRERIRKNAISYALKWLKLVTDEFKNATNGSTHYEKSAQ